ncbi:MAG: ATPase P [Eggerthellaceae bacterium]|nr:ATPase P [Eggerthellaceae bacterium]
MTIEIPGRAAAFEIRAVAVDFNGTIARDGVLIDGVAERMRALAAAGVEGHVLTADTYGTGEAPCAGLGAVVRPFAHAGAAECKEEIVRGLAAEAGCEPGVGSGICAIGNGFNDVQMFDAADLRICVLEAEGAYAGLLAHADVVVRDARDAFDLLLCPNRLRATLRN